MRFLREKKNKDNIARYNVTYFLGFKQKIIKNKIVFIFEISASIIFNPRLKLHLYKILCTFLFFHSYIIKKKWNRLEQVELN